jgi:L-ascorbate metabolism protein UlaG (beta-lactamase superfamily)
VTLSGTSAGVDPMQAGPAPRSEDEVSLRHDVVLEPLVRQFYAWLFLVAPGTSSMYFARLLEPLLTSFLDSPRLHRESAADPRLRGGMFVGLEEDRVEQVRQLVESIRADQSVSDLATGMAELTEIVNAEARGFDLTEVYAKVPDALRGYVEVTYDLSNHPRIRLLEPLLYRSRYYDDSLQIVDLSVAAQDERPFMMTTPRLAEAGHIQLRLPFADTRIDTLMATSAVPRRFGDLFDMVGVDPQDAAAFASLFSPTGAPPPIAFDGPGVRVRYFGHACVVLESRDATVISDPFIAHIPGPDRYTTADLPSVIDYCVLTHLHPDHTELGTLLRLRHRLRTVVVPKTTTGSACDPSPRLALQALGFTEVLEVEAGDVLEIEGGRIVACPFLGEHSDLDIAAKVSYAVELEGKRVFFGADARGVEPRVFSHINELLGDLDVAFLGMECDGAPLTWLYGPLYAKRPDVRMSRSRKLSGSDAKEARAIVDALGARQAYVYAMGREAWLMHIMAMALPPDSYQRLQAGIFVEGCRRDGIDAEELLGRGEWQLS